MTAASTRYPNNLPKLPSNFIGRERERSEVKRLVASTRLLTLTGAGGCGKTRLAIVAAESLLQSSAFEHGAWFVDLAGLDAPQLIPQAVATTLGVSEAHDRSLGETLADYLQHKKLLLILDNCEHLLAGCAESAQLLLKTCLHLNILATSREPLNVPDEIVWLVPSLGLPEVKSSVLHIAKSEAVQLFVARAGEALPDFKLDERNAVTVAQICHRLDGIPLAIELAAARVKLLDVMQIALRLDDSLQLLTRGQRTAVPRHQTLRAALDWSYHLLRPHERALFRRLAVFAGSCTLEDIEGVCVDDPPLAEHTSKDDLLHAVDIRDLLSELIDKSLVTITKRVPGIATRYRLLEPVRQYALEALRASNAEVGTRDMHLDYFLGFAERVESELRSGDQLPWLRQLDQEHDNLRAALAWGLHSPIHAVTVMRLATALHLFWQRRGYWSEGRRWLEQAVAHYDTHASLQSPGSRLYLGRAIVATEWLSVNRGDFGTAQQNLERGLALAQAANDPETMSYALGLLAAMSAAGDTSAANRQIEACVECAERSGNLWALALAKHIQGRVLYRGGDGVAARAALLRSEALFRETGDQWSIATILSARAGITDDLDVARDLYEETLSIFGAFEHREQQIITASNLAGLALIQGDTLRAESLFEQVLVQAQELQNKATIAFCQRGLGRLRILQSDFDTAEKLLRESMVLDRETGHQIWFALSLAGLSRIAAARDQRLPAARVFGAIAAFVETNAIHLDADDRVELEQHEVAVRDAMSSAEFAVGFEAGQALTLDQALQEIPPREQQRDRAVQPIEPAPGQLRLCALGPAQVYQGEQVVAAWLYARVKELLFYLAVHPSCTKAQIGLALWPDASPVQLRNSLSTTLYHLRRALGQRDWIIFEDDQYHFNRTRAYWFDVDAFESNLAEAARIQSSAPEQAIDLLQSALAWYQGDFVEDLQEGDWFLLRREELRRKYLDALLQLGRLLLARADYAGAAGTYHRAIEKDEVLEEAHRELMRCQARLGERDEALRHYQLLVQVMRDKLGSAPAAESLELYERLQRGDDV